VLIPAHEAQRRAAGFVARLLMPALRGHRAATSADYALLSPCVGRYGYGAPQRRVCDESFACYLLWEPAW
jgi:hypothetical protein